MERLDDPRLARRFVTSRLLYRRLRRYLWAPPLLLAAIALLLRVDFVIDGLGRIFRSPGQQSALQRAYDATWFSRFVVTVVIAVALLVVLAVVVAAHLARHLARPRRRVPALPLGERPLGDAPHRARPARDRWRGRPRRDPGRGGSGCGRGHRRGRAHARAVPPRRRLLRLPGSDLRGCPRAPRSLRTAPDVPPPPPAVDPRDRDRRRPARAPQPGGDRPAHGHSRRTAGDLGHRDQRTVAGGRGPPRTGGQLARRRVVAAGPRGGGRPHSGTPDPAPGRGLPLRGGCHRPAVVGDRTATDPPAPDRRVPARHRGAGGRGPHRHRRHRDDHALARGSTRPAPLLGGRRRAARARRWACIWCTRPTSSPCWCAPACSRCSSSSASSSVPRPSETRC